MGKKRKSKKPAGASGPREVDIKDARIGAVNSWRDVADEQDEYFMNADEIGFDDDGGPDSKRQKRQEEEDAFLEESEEEVLAYDDGEDDESDGSDGPEPKQPAKKSKKQGAESDDDPDRQEEDGGDQNWWGSSRKDYYGADNVETEENALEEEAEAKRLQKEKLSKMADEDFVFDGDEWLNVKEDTAAGAGDDPDDDDRNVVTEVLEEAEIPEDMSAEDRYRLLKARHPEFEPLVGEFQELQPQLAVAQKEAEGKPGKSVAAVRYWVLGCYVAALASYFALLTSPSRDESGGGGGMQKTMNPSELRDHDVMETLLACQAAWKRVKTLKEAEPPQRTDATSPEDSDLQARDDGPDMWLPDTTAEVLKPKKKKKKVKALKNAEAAEEALASLEESLPLAATTKKHQKKKASRVEKGIGGDTAAADFGEEEYLEEREAAEKARRSRSLRFYTSQIVQKANKAEQKQAGGDTDVAYRERFKDRQIRLNAEAERRGRKESKHGAALGGGQDGDEDGGGADDDGDDDEAQAATAKAIREAGEEEYYNLVAGSAAGKKATKEARYAALAEAGKGELVVPTEVVGEDGKRKITYAIEKNKGLTPKRKKENRNPRVKKRMRYDKKMKKLASMKPTYKGPPEGGYHGVETGIKAGLIKSVKF